MDAKKCDRCRKYYDSYGAQNDRNNTNSVMFVNATKNGQHYFHGIIDLCPECMNEIKEFVKTDGGTK